jgi:hypothetical protein
VFIAGVAQGEDWRAVVIASSCGCKYFYFYGWDFCGVSNVRLSAVQDFVVWFCREKLGGSMLLTVRTTVVLTVVKIDNT